MALRKATKWGWVCLTNSEEWQGKLYSVKKFLQVQHIVGLSEIIYFDQKMRNAAV